MNVKRIYNIFTPWKIELYYRMKGLFCAQKSSKLVTPEKILLCNQGALGDVFLTTCLIPALKEAFPKSFLGTLIAPASCSAVEGCPGVDAIHEEEPWFAPKDGKWEKLHKAVQKQKRSYDYDWVICTFPFYRGVGSSLKNIPIRICFETLGDRIYFNQVVSWESGYIGKQYIRLLQFLGIQDPYLQCPWNLKPSKEEYVVFHIGSADATKEYPLFYWEDLLEIYRKEGRKVFFTGNGPRQMQMIEKIVSTEENLCGKLSFFQFLQKIASADHVVTVDTVTLHIAAMLKTPYFALFRKRADISLWYPDTSEGVCLLEN